MMKNVLLILLFIATGNCLYSKDLLSIRQLQRKPVYDFLYDYYDSEKVIFKDPRLKTDTVYRIALTNFMLDTLPFTHEKFPYLQAIYFEGGRYILPPGLSKFKNLQIIHCRRSALGGSETSGVGMVNRYLPEDVVNLKHLKELTLSGVYLENLYILNSIRSLEKLNFDFWFFDPSIFFMRRKIEVQPLYYMPPLSYLKFKKKRLNNKFKKVEGKLKNSKVSTPHHYRVTGYLNNSKPDSTWIIKEGHVNILLDHEFVMHFKNNKPHGLWQFCSHQHYWVYLYHTTDNNKFYIYRSEGENIIWGTEGNVYKLYYPDSATYKDVEKIVFDEVEKARAVNVDKTYCTEFFDEKEIKKNRY